MNLSSKLLILIALVCAGSNSSASAFHWKSHTEPVPTGFSVVSSTEDLKSLPGGSNATDTSQLTKNNPSSSETGTSQPGETGMVQSPAERTSIANNASKLAPNNTNQLTNARQPKAVSSSELSVPALQSLARYPSEIPNLRMVSGRLLRGGQPTDAGLNLLKNSGVKTIIDLRAEEPKIAESERKTVESLGMKFVHIPMYAFDTPDNKQFQRFLNAVSIPENGPVYLHCLQGRDRTGTMTGAYRIVIENWTFDNAFKEMMACGYRPGFANMTRSLHDLAVAKGDKSALPTASFVAADLKSRFRNFAKRSAPAQANGGDAEPLRF